MTTQPRKGSWGRRRWTILGGGVAVFLLLLYFVLTSGPVLKALILPRVSAALNAKVEAGAVSVSPFSEIRLHQVVFEPKGQPQLFAAQELLLRYSLLSLLRGKIEASQVQLVAPQITVVEGPNGKGNLSALLQSQSSPTSKAPAAKSTHPLLVDLHDLSITNGLIRYTRQLTNGTKLVAEVSELNLGVDQVKNQGSGKLTVQAALSETITAGPGSSNANTQAQATLTGNLAYDLAQDLAPNSVKGNLRLALNRATGEMRDLAGLALELNANYQPGQLHQLALTAHRGQQALGELQLSGPVDPAQRTANLKLEINGLSHAVLDLVGAPFGLSFGNAQVDGTATAKISQQGSQVAADGQFRVSQLVVHRQAATSPQLDLDANFGFSANLDNQTAQVAQLQLSARQQGKRVVWLTLNRPLSLAWGKVAPGETASQVKLNIDNLNLASWRSFVGPSMPSGQVRLAATLTSQSDGKQFNGIASGEVRNLQSRLGTNTLQLAQIAWKAQFGLSNFRQFTMPNLELDLGNQGQSQARVQGSLSFDLANQDTSLKLHAIAPLPTLLQCYPVPNCQVQSGLLTIETEVSRPAGPWHVSGTLGLSNLVAQLPPARFTNYAAHAQFAVDATPSAIKLSQLQLTAGPQNATPGEFDLSGSFAPDPRTGKLKFSLSHVSQSTLAPFLAPFLTPMTLASLDLKGNGTLGLDPAGTNTVEMQARAAKIQLVGPNGPLTATPLDLGLDLNLAQSGEKVVLHRVSLLLPPTPRATNQVNLEGLVDLSPNHPVPSTLSLQSDALDLTPLYLAFTSNQTATAAKPAPTATKASHTSPTPPAPHPAAVTEPPPMHLPLPLLTATAQLDVVYLGDIAATNCHVGLVLSNDVVRLQPSGFGLNGAPVTANASVDLRQAGYKYALDWQAKGVPLPPFVSTFAPSRKGELNGEVSTTGQIQGAGITPTNLVKNLAGQFDFGTTNLNLALGKVRSALLKTVVNVLLSLPELVRNPTSTLGSLASQLTGKSQGGWVDQLSQSPINVIAAHGSVAHQQLDLAQALVQSPAFEAATHGTVGLNPIFTNSTVELPVSVSLRQDLAAKIGLGTSNSTSTNATNEDYAPVPDFLTIKGTVGEPKKDINAKALIEIAARAGAGILGNTGNASLQKAANLLGSVGNLVKGKSSSTTNTSTTSTNNTSKSNPLGLLDSLFKHNTNLVNTVSNAVQGTKTTTHTNSPSASTNSTSNPLELLNSLFNKKSN